MTTPLDLPLYDLDGWGGNYTDDAGVDWVVTSEDGWSSAPSARTSIDDAPNRHGGQDAPSWDAARVVTLAGIAIAPSRRAQNEAKDRINGCAPSGEGLHNLIVAEEHVTRHSLVRRSGEAKIGDKGGLAFEWSLTLVAPDPRKYDVNTRTASVEIDPGSGPGETPDGRVYDRVYPLRYVPEGTPIEGVPAGVIFNEGTRETGGLVVVRGGLSTPGIVNARTGQFLRFDLTLSAEDALEIDLLARTAILNGTASRRATLMVGSSWFLLDPGETAVRLTGQATGAGAPRMDVTYESAWS